MKFFTYIILFTSLISCNITKQPSSNQAQNNNDVKIIKLNFEDKKLDYSQVDEESEIQEGQFYQFKIENINMNLYDVKINTLDSTVSSSINMPTFGTLQLEALSAIVENIGSVTASKSKFEAIEDELNDNFKTVSLSAIPNATKGKGNFKELTEIGKKLISYKEALLLLNKKLKYKELSVENLKTRVTKSIFYNLDQLEIDDHISSKNLIDSISEMRISIIKLRDKVLTDYSLYLVYEKTIIDKIKDEKDFKTVNEAIKKSFSDLVITIDALFDSLNNENAKKLIESIIFLEKNKNQDYLSSQFQFNGERAILKYAITPRDSKFNLPTYKSSLIFPERSNKFISVGLSFYTSNLHDEVYSFESNPAPDTTFSIVEEDVSGFEIGMASIVRVGKVVNNEKMISGHFSFGPGVSITNKVRPRLLIGGGLSKGEKHMIALDAGIIVGPVDKLSKTIGVNDSYPEPINDPTISDLNIGWFLSLGYHFNF
ncbi:MAG: hypothetical protein RLO81_07775 [Fulvivirga sp.]|uniref:hypothetical protein n=1 Tax=Fulvivirga sp. TaxID=1931237 RepID=UPI0032ED9E1E